MVEGLKTHSKMKRNRAGKRTILVDGRGSENALEDEEENRAIKRTIHIDGRGLENALEDEGGNRAEKRTILVDGGQKAHQVLEIDRT